MLIENKPQYILTDDTGGLFSRLSNPEFLTQSPNMTDTFNRYFRSINRLLSEALGDDVNVVGFDEEELEERLTYRVKPFINGNPEIICICLDRFLLKTLESDPQYLDRFFRFNMCRDVNGKRIPRQGYPSFERQLEILKARIPDIQSRHVVVVDDGIFEGGTVREFARLSTENGIKLNIKKIVGFIGNPKNNYADLPPVEFVEPQPNLYEWVDVRDFTPLAGKTLRRSKTNKVTSSIPYLFPWSEGSDASLQLNPNFLTFSAKMIFIFKELVQEYEKVSGQTVTFRTLIQSGFPLPTSRIANIPVSINERAVDYLDKCLKLATNEPLRNVVVFDMDGTLYRLDGNNSGFSGSGLEKQVLLNAKKFIILKESCDDSTAEEIVKQGLDDPIGISNYLSQRYGISRTDYFDIVWDIDPTDIVKDYQFAKEVIKKQKIERPVMKLVLLTSAPRVWAKKVLEFLEVSDLFETIYTGDQYKTKKDIFQILASRYKPENILSVGDQKNTDIIPAQELGMKGFLLSKPDDLLLLVE